MLLKRLLLFLLLAVAGVAAPLAARANHVLSRWITPKKNALRLMG